MLVQSLLRAFVSLLHPRMLALMVWPALVALALWVALAVLFWRQVSHWIDDALGSTALVEWMIGVWPLSWFAGQLGWLVLVLLLVPLVLVTATLIIGVFAMPMMVDHVAGRSYAGLECRRGGGALGAAANALVASLWFSGLLALTLPLWLIPPLWPVLPVLLLGYLNYRMFAYDALAEHASPGELRWILGRERVPLYALGVIVALFAHVPLVGFFAPVFAGLAFIHYGLARLQDLRSAPIESVSVPVD